MTWFMVSDDQWTKFEVASTSARAQALWLRAGSYSAQQLTDGVLSRREISVLNGTLAAAQELVVQGFWESGSYGFRFKDWASSQPTRSQVVAKREKWKRAKSKTSVDFPPKLPRDPVPVPIPLQISSEEGSKIQNVGVSSAARAREERAPLPLPPLEVEPPPPTLMSKIVDEHAKRFIALRAGQMPKGDFRAAKEIAEWCEQNATAHKCSAEKLAIDMVAALYANERACSRLWPLAWVARTPQEFAPHPQGATRPQTGAQRRESAKAEQLKAAEATWDRQIAEARASHDEYTENRLICEKTMHLTKLSSWLDQKEAS